MLARRRNNIARVDDVSSDDDGFAEDLRARQALREQLEPGRRCPYLLPPALCPCCVRQFNGWPCIGSIMSVSCRLMTCAMLMLALAIVLALAGAILKQVMASDGHESIMAAFHRQRENQAMARVDL